MRRRNGRFFALTGSIAAVAAALAASISGCSEQPVARHEDARLYPTLAELYGAEQGLYAGCGPTDGVCHSAKQFPDLSTVGSIVDHVGDRCNELVEHPDKMHDLCERPGDLLVVGEEAIEIAWVEALDADAPVPQSWRLVLAAPFPAAGASTDALAIERGTEARVLVAELYDIAIEVEADDPRRVTVTLPPAAALPEDEEEEDEDPGTYMSALLASAGVPGDPAAIQLGDPNRNGNFGARLEGRLIKPGDPEKSFLVRRLTDPAAGPLMPLANCCHFRKEAVRALWCWIAGLDEDGTNALDPIDYAACPPGPMLDHLAYPELGDECEGSGMCPVQSTLPTSSDPTWANVYGNIMARRCAGAGCHVDAAAGGLSLADAESAWAELVDGRRVVPHDPEGSVLYARVRATCAPGASCDRMPLGLDPLSEPEIAAIRGWIESGAPR